MGRHPEKYGVVCGYSQRSAARDGEAAREASRRREQQRASAAALSMGLENLHNSRAGGGGHKDGQRAAGGCSALVGVRAGASATPRDLNARHVPDTWVE